jgi:hypothetical protein
LSFHYSRQFSRRIRDIRDSAPAPFSKASRLPISGKFFNKERGLVSFHHLSNCTKTILVNEFAKINRAKPDYNITRKIIQEISGKKHVPPNEIINQQAQQKLFLPE